MFARKKARRNVVETLREGGKRREQDEREGEGEGVAATRTKKRKNGGVASRRLMRIFSSLPRRGVACRGVRGKTVAENEERVIGHRPAILEHGETDEDSGIEGRNVRNAEKEWKLRERGGTEKGNRADRERERKREKETMCVCVCVRA